MMQTAEHWASIPKVVGSIPRCGYTLRVTSQASYSPEYITRTQKNIILNMSYTRV